MFRAMLIWDRRVAQSELSRHRDVVRALFFETVAELLVICWLALGLQLLLSQK
jgi:hypothetical protein